MTKPKRWAGRRKWAHLIRTLTQLAEKGTTERTRLTAALRLADVLLVREERELAEMRRTERLATAAKDAASVEPAPTEQEPADPLEAAREFLAKIKENNGTE